MWNKIYTYEKKIEEISFFTIFTIVSDPSYKHHEKSYKIKFSKNDKILFKKLETN
jgi:hypothetical protein